MSQETVFTGYAQYKERLKPAALSEGEERGKINSTIIGSWLVQNGINVNELQTPEEVADALYRATVANFPKLRWDVKPKALLAMIENSKGRNQTNALHEQQEFAERSKAAEKAREYQKAQDGVKKQLDQFIENIVFVDGLRGVVDHSKTGKVKDACNKHLANGIAGKRDLAQVGLEIRNFVAGEFEKEEKARERM